MEVIMVITLFICCFLTAVITKSLTSKNKYCNSNYNCANESTRLIIDEPAYTVIAIKEVKPKNKASKFVAEYILRNFYIDNLDSVERQKLIMYDEIGKYQIGDILTFKKE